MSDTSSQTGSATVGTGPQTGFLDPAPGTTDAQHREMVEMDREQAEDPGSPPPPPPVPPVISGESAPSEGDEGEEGLEHLLASELGLSADIEVGIGERLRETYGMRSPEDDIDRALRLGRRMALMPAQKAFQTALEHEEDPNRLSILLDTLDVFKKTYEYGVGVNHYSRFADAVQGRVYSQIETYVRTFKALIAFEERP